MLAFVVFIVMSFFKKVIAIFAKSQRKVPSTQSRRSYRHSYVKVKYPLWEKKDTGK